MSKFSTQSIDELFQQGDRFFKSNQLDEAALVYRCVAKLSPNSAKAFHNLGNVLVKQEELKEAIDCYRNAIQLNPQSAASHYRLADIFYRQNCFDEAISNYRLAIELEPNNTHCHYNLGKVLSISGKWDEAIASYRQALELDPNLYDGYHKLKSAILMANEPSERVFDNDRSNLDTNLKPEITSILFVLPASGGGGGSHSIVQECLELHRYGVKVKIAIDYKNYPSFLKNYSDTAGVEKIAFIYRHLSELKSLAREHSIVCATTYKSAKIVELLLREIPTLVPAYYIQDYEPLFEIKDTFQWNEAWRSYTLLPKAISFAKTDWLCRVVSQNHGVIVHKVEPSIDHQVYYPDLATQRTRLEISMMVRLSSLRRAPLRTLKIAKKLQEMFGDRIHFTIFGSKLEEINAYKHFIPEETSILGHLHRADVATILRGSDIFLDLSDYQAFGRTALEAMASGCIPVVPGRGGTNEFAIDKVNSLVVDTTSEEECIKSIANLIQADREELKQYKLKAIETATNYSIKRAACSIWNLLQKETIESSKDEAILLSQQNALTVSQTINVEGIVTLRDDGEFASSSYIRVVQPYSSLQDEGVKLNIDKSPIGLSEDARILVVQRNAIKNEERAQKMLQACDRQQTKLIFEIDDDLLNLRLHSAEELRIMELVSRSARVITVSSETLARQMRHFNSNVIILPNVLDDEIWRLDRQENLFLNPPNDLPLRLLYMGTRTHQEDFDSIAPALEQLKEEFGSQLEIDLIGICHPKSTPTWANNLKIPTEVSLYPDFVRWLKSNSQWQIGLAPLVDSTLNQSKSYLKFLDYSGLGIPVVASANSVYSQIIENKVNGLLVDDRCESWYLGIKQLLQDNELRHNLARNAFASLVAKHTLKTAKFKWLEAIQVALQK
jgi:glycosyltransferase involved in cell wall biosynthesis